VERGRGAREELAVSPLRTAAPPPSKESDRATSIQFVNRSGREVALYWIAPDGTRKPYGDFGAGGRVEQETYAGHVWLVADRDGRPIASVTASGRPGRTVIRSARF
jgi:hypothetical protein